MKNSLSRREFLRRTSAASAAVALSATDCLGVRKSKAYKPPKGVKAVWNLDNAYRETTPTRERICINGLWRWQPIEDKTEKVPEGRWGYFKVPGPWPGITSYMQKDFQMVYPHPSWEQQDLGNIQMAWYQREFTVPKEWAGRRITVHTEYLNSYAAVYVDGRKAGDIRFPCGEVEITSACRPGGKHVLSLLTVAMPLEGVMLSYNDTNAAKRIKGRVARRGLCGDVFLVSIPAEEHISDIKIDTSVRKWEITFNAALEGFAPGKSYSLHTQVVYQGRSIKEFNSQPFKAADLKEGRFAFTHSWKPPELWDVHTPQNMYEIQFSLLDAGGKVLDTYQPVRFGFREFWIDGRDFYLNGTRFHCSTVPLDNAQVGAAAASYQGARETMLRLKTFGINTVYTHNYGCQPGSHLSFAEILRAADDVGMLVSFSQPHFGHYDWNAHDADETNGYAWHAAFYVRVAQNHPSVAMYAMNHNATGYSEDMNPDMIDGIYAKRDSWSSNNAKRALRAEAIVRRLDPTRVIYHHSSGNLGQMHTSNFYLNFVPIQERSDWFEHWATEGVKPLFLCEYGVPFSWSWTMYRGWYKGKRAFGDAKVPWEFCAAEWNAQFLGDRAFRISEMEKTNLRWEAGQFRAGKLWHRWDYPYRVGSNPRRFQDRQTVWAMYITDNWRAFRTWGLSAFTPWDYGVFWKLRPGVEKGRKTLQVDWDRLQRPGFSPDYIEQRYERVDMAFERSDWIPTVAGQALVRNNQPLLAYIAGKSSRFTSTDHNFHAGETVEKQIIVINNCRETVTCHCAWLLDLPTAVSGNRTVRIATGQQQRIPLRFQLPATLEPGAYQISMTARFNSGQTQDDSFAIHIIPKAQPPKPKTKIALFDPKGETGKLLSNMGVRCESLKADADMSAYNILIVGKGALTVEGAAPNIRTVRDGLKVLMFEQTSDVLEKRFGFRVQEYGLRRAFKRVPDHPVLEGLRTENLRNWRGEATLVPPRRKYELRPRYGPTITRCGIQVTRAWRCGNYGNVSSVLIEKPARGDFLPIVDGGFSLQYSPLMEYREGKGMVMFCQMDVTGRTESEPAAKRLVQNLLAYVSAWTPAPRRKALYLGEQAGRTQMEMAGILIGSYTGGKPRPENVLIVGPGGGKMLTPHKGDIAGWLKQGGHVLAIGLGESEARAFLPFTVAMKKAEHIATYFRPAGVQSLVAGIGPADVYNRDPRNIALVSGGATPVGNGVLGVAMRANVVFFQMVPWQFDYKKGYSTKRTFRRASFLLTRLLGNMGVIGQTPLLDRFSSPVKERKGKPPEQRWLQGFYLESPAEMDDPYRFFRW